MPAGVEVGSRSGHTILGCTTRKSRLLPRHLEHTGTLKPTNYTREQVMWNVEPLVGAENARREDHPREPSMLEITAFLVEVNTLAFATWKGSTRTV